MATKAMRTCPYFSIPYFNEALLYQILRFYSTASNLYIRMKALSNDTKFNLL